MNPTIIYNKENPEHIDYILPELFKPFVDRIVITNHCEDDMGERLIPFLLSIGFETDDPNNIRKMKHKKFKHSLVIIRQTNDIRKQANSYTFSGQCIRAMQHLNEWGNFVNIVGSVPHSISSIDLSMDVNGRSFKNIYRAILRKEKIDQKRLSFSQKNQKGRTWFEHIHYGSPTVSGYIVGKQGQKKHGKIYDKTIEMMVEQNINIEQRVRYEITINDKTVPTLTDIINPDALFYYLAPALLLKDIPKDIEPWEHNNDPALLPWKLPLREMKPLDNILIDRFQKELAEMKLMGDYKDEKILALFNHAVNKTKPRKSLF